MLLLCASIKCERFSYLYRIVRLYYIFFRSVFLVVVVIVFILSLVFWVFPSFLTSLHNLISLLEMLHKFSFSLTIYIYICDHKILIHRHILPYLSYGMVYVQLFTRRKKHGPYTHFGIFSQSKNEENRLWIYRIPMFNRNVRFTLYYHITTTQMQTHTTNLIPLNCTVRSSSFRFVSFIAHYCISFIYFSFCCHCSLSLTLISLIFSYFILYILFSFSFCCMCEFPQIDEWT